MSPLVLAASTVDATSFYYRYDFLFLSGLGAWTLPKNSLRGKATTGAIGITVVAQPQQDMVCSWVDMGARYFDAKIGLTRPLFSYFRIVVPQISSIG